MAVELEGKERKHSLPLPAGSWKRRDDKGKEYFTIDFGEDFVMEKPMS